MGFFSGFFGKIFKTIAPIAIGVATGNPLLGAAAGAAIGASGGGGIKGAAIGGLGGYFGSSAVSTGLAAGEAAASAGSGILTGNTTAGIAWDSALTTGVKAAVGGSVLTGANALSTLSAASGVLGLLSSPSNANAARQGGVVSPTAPANDPAAVDAANASADEEARRRARGQASTILTSPLGVGKNGLSASQLLLG